MDLGKKAIIIFLTIMGVLGICTSTPTIHQVGDIAGWTSDRSVDYKDWAAMIQVHVGDIIHFEYDPGFHNVVQVSRSDFHTCNTKNPITTYSSGNDYIKIRRHGHYFYICGFPDHCELTGQKVDIRVPKYD